MKITNTTSIPLNIITSERLALSKQPLSAAVPFAQSAATDLDAWSLCNSANSPVVHSLTPTSCWSDGSVKWALLKTVLNPEADCATELFLKCDSFQANPDTLSAPHSSQLVVNETSDSIDVQDSDLKYLFSKNNDCVFPDVYAGQSRIWEGNNFRIFMSNTDSDNLIFHKQSLTIDAQDTVSVAISAEGKITVSPKTHLDVTLRFEVLSGKWLKLSLKIHNSHRAQHPGSIWDLGDDGSINFNEFSLRYTRNKADSVKLQAEYGHDWITAESSKTTLFQASSGGENWDSPNHVDAERNVQNKFKGYRINASNSQTIHGDRASPVVWVDTDNSLSWGVKVSQYWQNFPKCLSFDDSAFTIGLFPGEHGHPYELQGGERKNTNIVFSFSDNTDSLDWVDHPAVLATPSARVMESKVLRYANNDGGDTYNNILTNSLDPHVGFFEKREIIDEFGWRNFGDIYADHETLYHDSEELFISHYNNQYDPIYGFGRQYLLTGDPRWYQLMADLVNHVLDIDIYRTSEDKAEYNYGLFWHTDHYKQASTCTHRTYTRDNYIDWDGEKGGGPGREHCYTNGLLLYYQLTGNTDARDAVVGLAGWIRHWHEGTGTVVETVLNMVSVERRKFLSLCKGHKLLRYRYGFDRGTGNYIRALLDSFEITRDASYIGETEAIIMNTFSSNDDLSARALDNPELTWFYSIFLQDVIRYLDLKRELGEMDAAFCYARNGLLHYARWMADNETPFLSQPERLDYPNDTWIAQDIRKANVLYASYRYATDDRDVLLIQARFFRDYVLKSLADSDTLHFSRIQVIMLQNHGASGLMDIAAKPYSGLDSLTVHEEPLKDCFYTLPSFSSDVIGQIAKAIRGFSLNREIKWVRTRIG